ncbi:MAG: GNAT family N-acetyltransferase [Acidimicrobiales bacterium]
MASVLHDPDHDRFVAHESGQTAELVYHRRDDRLVLAHTEVPLAIGGQGVGGRLVAAAMAWAGAEGLTVVPTCPFAAHWIEAHPEVAGPAPLRRPEDTAGR